MGKYGNGDHKWFSKAISSPYGTGVWGGILKGWESFVRHIRFEVGDGTSIRFWKDTWCGERERELCRSFLILFSLAPDNDCLISSVLQVSEGKVFWNLNFRRHFHDWELEICMNFSERNYNQHLEGSSEDNVRWDGFKSNIFSVKSYYNILSSMGCVPFP